MLNYFCFRELSWKGTYFCIRSLGVWVTDARLLSPCFVFVFCLFFVIYLFIYFFVLGASEPLQSSCYFLSFLSSACTHITTARETRHIFVKFKCRILRQICCFSIVWNYTKITETLYGELFLLASLAYLGLLIISRGCGWGGGGRGGEALIVPTHHHGNRPVVFFELLLVNPSVLYYWVNVSLFSEYETRLWRMFWTENECVRARTYVCVCVYICMYVYMYVLCMYVCMHACV